MGVWCISIGYNLIQNTSVITTELETSSTHILEVISSFGTRYVVMRIFAGLIVIIFTVRLLNYHVFFCAWLSSTIKKPAPTFTFKT